jgi:FKBP-type peptidyl-prolyl cis-trans isomerase (trigger factor)
VAFNLKDDPRMQQRLHGAAGLLSPKDIDAPPAELPPLDTIVVTVKTPEPPSEAEILQRYKDRLRAIAVVTPRKHGDPIKLGDEVALSTVGHVNGALVSGSIKHEHWIELVPDASLPGFVEQLIGQPVGSACVVPVVLEDGRAASFAVRIVEASAVELPHPERQATVDALGIARTLEATLTRLGEELIAEAQASAPLAAMHAAMTKLASLAKVDVPATAVDAEIARVWRMSEGEACVALGLTVEEQQEAQKLWLNDAGVRADATDRLRAWAALKAVVVRDQLTLTPQGWERFLAAFEPAVGPAPKDIDPKTKSELEELAFRMQVVDHVMAKVAITFA